MSVAVCHVCSHLSAAGQSHSSASDPNAYEQQSSVHPIRFVQRGGKLWKCMECVFLLRRSHLATAASCGGGVGPSQSCVVDKIGNSQMLGSGFYSPVMFRMA